MKKNKLIITSLISCFFALFFVDTSVFANERHEIQISPSKSDILELKSGEIASGSFNVNNIGTEPLNFTITVKPYSVVDKNYNTNYELETNYTKISQWITYTTDKNILQPGESTEINYTITVPSDAPAGGQYAAIIASINEEASGNIHLVGSVGYVIYAHVFGETRTDVNILENNIPSLFLSSPISTSSLVENNGNIDMAAEYSLEISNFFSGQEVYSNVMDSTKHIVLPETQRFATQTWQETSPIGIFRVKQTVTIGIKTLVNEKIVFVCPIWLLFVIFFAIVLMITWLISRSRARKRQLS